MSNFENPFSTDRAEQLGDKLFEFFASHKSFEGLLRLKSLILEGGRGSGKTMFYLYHSYNNKKKEALSKGVKFEDFFKEENLIGLHFRADSNFVPAFQHKGVNEEEWVQLFAHYLNINLTKRLIEVILDINSAFKNSGSEKKISFELSEELQILLKDDTIIDFSSFLKSIKKREIQLISYINNLHSDEKPNLIINGFLINLLARSVLSQEVMHKKSMHIFIDEYENMLPYQQKIINTLIKHPDPVIFDVGMRKEGLKTYETLSDSEIISAPHDYNHFDLEELEDSQYEELIIKICEKRLSRVKELQEKHDNKFFDIRYYLDDYNYRNEAQQILKSSGIKELKISLKNRVGTSNADFKVLYDSLDPILLRLNIVLLDRGHKPNELSSELNSYLKKENSKYKNWIHNNKMGVVFLLAKEYRKDKIYSGFNTYKSVSSGISRYFIELCENAFKNAYRNGFSFNEPRKISQSEQTNSAYYVSKYKINDIETYTPNSDKLKRFIMYLGSIFKALHNDKKLSEPERNHFSTQYDMLTEESKGFLNNAILYSVFQKREQTKDKDTSIDSNNSEYHLNHIYAPYFQISARRIRSLKIDASQLEILIHGETAKAKTTANSFVKRITNDDDSQLKIDL